MLHVVRLDKNQRPGEVDRLSEILKATIPGRQFTRIKSVSDFLLRSMAGEIKEILFAVAIPKNGYAPEWQDLIASLMERPNLLNGAKAVVLVDGEGQLFTKDLARKLIFAANMSGCSFPGKPLVEATGDLYNFKTRAMVKGIDNMGAYIEAVNELLDKLAAFEPAAEQPGSKLKILAIHAGNKETSNTLMLLDMVKEHLFSEESTSEKIDYKEISIRNGDIVDCRGCGFDTCKHFGEMGECFYGGVMVEQVYPAIMDCDALILACPNYNDAVGANMMALFNRLTALFYNNSFENKKLYALIVSGYSGGDLVAEQIIGAMSCNKGFALPGHFAMLETANNPGDIANVEGIRDRAKAFAESILMID